MPLIYFTTVPRYHSAEYQGILFCLPIGKRKKTQINNNKKNPQAFFTLQLFAFKQHNRSI